MDKKTAQEMLMAVSCCTIIELRCYDCPLYEDDGRCRPWTDSEVAEAVRVLKEDGE
jgi:hypothetical protein